MLDTGPLAGYLFNRQPTVNLVRPWIESRQAATSIVVYGEVVEYLAGRVTADQRIAELRILLQEITPHFLTYRIMDRYAEVRRQPRWSVISRSSQWTVTSSVYPD